MVKNHPGPGGLSRRSILFSYYLPPGIFLMLFTVFSAAPAPADIIFLGAGHDGAGGSEQVQAAASMFGLTVETVRTTDELIARAEDADLNRTLDGMVIAAAMLDRVDRQRLLAFYRFRESPVPVLILDITRETGATLLQDWSGGTIDGSLDLRSGSGWIRVSRLERLARGLSGLEFLISEPVRYSGLEIAGTGTTGFLLGMDTILDIDTDEEDTRRMPLVIRRLNQLEEVFLAGKIRLEQQDEPDDSVWLLDPRRLVEAVPLFLFFRYLHNSAVELKPSV